QKTKAAKAAEARQLTTQDAVTPGDEIEQYRQIIKASEISPLGGLTKLILLVVSMVLLCLGFRLSFSWQTVLILLGVLTFHEGGQIWDILLFRRTPMARAIFLGLCAALLFGAGLFGVFGKAFIAFGAVLLMQFPAQIRQAKLVKALRRQYGSSLSSQSEETI